MSKTIMRLGCCCNCWYRKFDVDGCEVDYKMFERKSVKMKRGDACFVCNNVFFQPKGSRRIHLMKR